MGFFSALLKLLFPKTDSDISSNNRYIEDEKRFHKELFDDIDGKSLDDNQRTAVVDDSPRQLVVAGAGSGKTLTISAKVKYLVDVKGISPDEILLISYTKKAAQEMHDRISRLGIDIDSSTFHKYGLKILTQVEKKQPDIVDDISVYLDSYLSDHIFNDAVKSKDFLCLIGLLMIPISSEKASLGDKIEIEESQNIRTLRDMAFNAQKITLKNEKVKSAEEVYLANTFFLDGIDYEYESAYKYDEKDNYRKKYRPDFYLKDYEVYWEHFGINKNNRAPQYDSFHENEYLKGMRWKHELHYKNQTKLAETYSWQFSEHSIDKAIKANYKRFNIEPKPIDYREVIKQIERNNKNSQFSRVKSLIITFVSLFRSYGYDISFFKTIEKDIRKDDYVIPKNYNIEWKKNASVEFLRFVKGFYEYYVKTLTEKGLIDFNDMILKASDYISNGKCVPTYKYVIIDEFQDISYSRYKLVKETLDVSGAKLFCVGDDWQSIFKFSGSDIDIFVNFKKYFGTVSRTDITKTYRNSQELIDITSRFILHNTYQLRKKLVSDKHNDAPIRFIKYYEDIKSVNESASDKYAHDLCDAFELALKDITGDGSKVGNEIMVLGRMRHDVNLLKVDSNIRIQDISGDKHIQHKSYPELNMIFRTVHSSKGLEADHVIVLNLLKGELGFPSQIVDDPIISLLQKNTEGFLYAEERRLFYVALTRTKNHTYLLVPEINKSCFATELENDMRKNEIKYIFRSDPESVDDPETPVLHKCPVCKTGILVIKSISNGKQFVGCSNYPKCDYALWDIKAVKNNIRCPQCGGFLVERKGKYGNFLGCSNYPECFYTKEIDCK